MSPSGQERRFPTGYADTLMRVAEGDLRSADFGANGVESGDVRPENVLFLYQQSIEKALKATLRHLGIPIPLIPT
jgi:HEPN domain-containing protein